MKEIKSIQIIGTQRSGSNLLRVMLNQLEEIDAPHPPHILKRFFPLLPKYGNLQIESNFNQLLDDVCQLVELNPVPWKSIILNREALRKNCSNNNLIEIFNSLYEYKANSTNAKYWCCKSMSNIHYINSIESSGIKPLYIHLYRDGRDVALSFKKAVVGQKHVYHIAKQWHEEQELCLKLAENIGESRVFPISYESLIMNPKSVLKKLCDFLQVTYTNNMLEFYNSDESGTSANSGDMWKNLAQPIMKNNFNKFSKELNTEDIEIFESIAGETLLKLDYTLFSSKTPIKRTFSKEKIEMFDKQNNVLKKQSIISTPNKDLDKRKGQFNLLQNIKKAI